MWRLLAVFPVAVLETAAAPAQPRFSWDTVPVFFHSCNFTGAYTDDAIKVMAKFPMVTIEKGQGVMDPTDKRYAEDKIIDTLRRVKEADSNISTIFYYNSVLDWPFYKLHQEFLQRPEWWVKKKDGSVCRLGGDGSFPNHTNMLSFDFAQSGARAFWASECINATKSRHVDGCFSDRSNGVPCGDGDEYKKGHLKVHQDLQAALGNGVLISNNAVLDGVGATMIEGFQANEDSIKKLMQWSAAGKLVQAHAGYGADGADDHCSKGITNSLAAFLIGAGERSYYQCSRGWKVQADPIAEAWRPEYEKSLGAPQGAAVKTGDVYERKFSGKAGITTVRFNAKTNIGTIVWAGSPSPPPTPPGSCDADAMFNHTGISNHDITPMPWSAHTAESAMSCCEACQEEQSCVAWTWYSDGTKECHFHDSWSGRHTDSHTTYRVSGNHRKDAQPLVIV